MNFESINIPQGFALCLNNDCPMATTCTRSVVFRNLPATIERITMLNPKALPPSDTACSHYHEYHIVRNAYGFKKMYKMIPVGSAKMFWASIPGIPSESTYYRMKRGQIAIPPTLQRSILDSAIKCGAPSDVQFDDYKDEIGF